MRFSFRDLIIIPSLVLFLTGSAGGSNLRSLTDEPIQLDKPAISISEKTLTYLRAQNRERVKVWVYFNDKGVFNSAQFRAAAAEVALAERAIQRRNRAGIEGATFADLPVDQNYINDVVSLGGILRRVSKWLNAASFEIDIRAVEQVAAMPFVNKVVPVAGFTGSREVVSEIEAADILLKPAEADALNYGQSQTQVQMINVPAMHDKGFKGEGVVVAMLDTGYRKSHQAFARAFGQGRILAEYDFIFNDGNTQNETGDASNQHNHGSYCWSTLGGNYPGKIYGPAYGATFLLAKTEDVRSETPVEEDNWVAALEWADTYGAEVISSSLGYSDWYVYPNFDGATATTSIAAGTAAGLGIIICNSMGNEGPSPGTLSAPADAFDILACGAVDAGEVLADFSSRGPTFDGRTKPEVCAMGVSTYCASGTGDVSYTYVGGTSLSTPLVGGAAALLLSANPALSPLQIRRSLMATADRAGAPDNDYGWGVIDVLAAYNWGANFTVDTAFAYDSLTVQFTDSSTPPATEWKWYFGDGDSSMAANPSHHYAQPGSYDVVLTTLSSEGFLSRLKKELIAVVADSFRFGIDSGYSGHTAILSVGLKNTQRLDTILLPISYNNAMITGLDSMTRGARTSGFELLTEISKDNNAGEAVYRLVADTGDGTVHLAPGDGEIARLYFALDSFAIPGQIASIDTGTGGGYSATLANSRVHYNAGSISGNLVARYVKRGDFNNSGVLNIQDITALINFLYKGGGAPITVRAADANSTLTVNIQDATYLINFLYKGGPPPVE